MAYIFIELKQKVFMPESTKTESSPSINELMSNTDDAERSGSSSAKDLYDEVLKEDPLQTHA